MSNFNDPSGFDDPAPFGIPARDLAGNFMDSFTDRTVTNNVPGVSTVPIRDLTGNLMLSFTGRSVTNLVQGAGVVTKALVTRWNTSVSTGKPLILLWNVLFQSIPIRDLAGNQMVSFTNRAVTNSVPAPVTKALSVVWHTRISTASNCTLVWNTLSNTQATSYLRISWQTRAIASKPLVQIWHTQTAASVPLRFVWNTRSAIGKPLIVRWNTNALIRVTKALVLKWAVQEPPPPPQKFIPLFISVEDVITDSHRKTARVVIYESLNGKQIYASDDLLVPGGLISGGVNFSNSMIRRRCSLAFIDRTGVLTPGNVDDIFTTYGHVVRIWRGVIVDDKNYEFPLGAFGITDVSVDDSGPGIQISIEGYDYGDLLSRRGLTQDYTVPKGTNFGDAIQTLLAQQMPGIQFNFVTTTYTTPALFFQTNANPWESAVMMAKSIGCDLFFDPEGVCTMRHVPDYSVAPVGFTYEEGEKSTALYVNKRYTNRDAYNYFIVTGEHSSNATTGGGGPIRGDAYDDNPASKTYYKGPYGTVPAPPVSSKLITTQDQATQAARGLLQNSIGRAERLHFNAIVNPLHEVGDVIQFTRGKSKINDRYVIDSGYIPLGHDQPMDLTTRVRQGTI